MSDTTQPAHDSQAYLWHFHNLDFNRRHWWADTRGPISNDAALFEVLRRHPDAKLIHETQWPVKGINESPLAYFICCHGLKLWCDLSAAEVEWWRECLQRQYPGKGVDSSKGVYDVEAQALDYAHGANVKAAVDDGARLAEVLRYTAQHYLAGRVILAIDPDITNLDDAVVFLTNAYRANHRRTKASRNRSKEWLSAIHDFEADEDGRNRKTMKRDKELFARYRAIFDGFGLTHGK